ncbi:MULTISPECIES: HAAS signaling domain-containing protein [Thalassotalea]|uniref:HAAS signaling domain-containing protein n=1 Tax=Thalassotalea TaxID=1518149 RepID=UPI00094335D2|nr:MULTISPECIES: hypothetical protein [Thalassotalea]OKY27854.1 hypothetical protein BI291_07305 [Thalassotalea sp. PP2-459]
MSERELINQYLKSLSIYLSRLDKSDANDVIREIESHLYDALELQQQQGKPSNAQVILDGFGEPRLLAQQYVEHVVNGAPPPEGFNAIQKVKRGVTKSLFYTMAFVGYGISLFLIVVGLCKLVMPEAVGVWSASQGNSITITISEHNFPQSQEVFGYWLIPIALLSGGFIAGLTTKILAALKRIIT